jgi:hypothetical protein
VLAGPTLGESRAHVDETLASVPVPPAAGRRSRY